MQKKSLGYIIVLVIIVVITLVSCVAMERNVQNDNYAIDTETKSARTDTRATRDTNSVSFTKRLNKSIPNVTSTKRTSTKNFTRAINLAYNHSHYNSSYNKNSNKIKGLVGKSVAKKMLSVVKPHSSMASPHNLSSSHNLKSITFSYGSYSIFDNNIPMNIIVKYQTPKTINASGNTKGVKPTQQTNTDVYSIDLNIIKGKPTYYLNYFESNADV